MSQRNLEKFRQAIDPYLDDWDSIDLRVIACQTRQGEWFFNSVRAVMEDEYSRAPIREDLPFVPRLLVAHERWEIDRLQTLLETFSTGELKVRDQRIIVKRFDGQNFQPVSSVDFRFHEREWSRSRFGVDYSSYVTKIWESVGGAMEYGEFEQIDSALRSADPPWDGLEDLRTDFLKVPLDDARRTDGATFEIIAPLRVCLTKPPILDDRSVQVNAERSLGTALQDVGVSIIAKGAEGALIRERHCLEETSKSESKSTMWASLNLPDVPTRATLILTYRGKDVDRGECFSPTMNPRIVVLENTVDSIGVLEGFLKKVTGLRLEGLVALLFHLLGFSAAPYGVLKSGVSDIIAYPDSEGWLLVIECTGREPDLNNKLTKLATRTKEVMEALPGFRVIPIVVTALTRSVVSKTDFEKAGKEGIAVITSEELAQLMQMAREGAGPPQARDYLLRFVPTAPIGW